MSPTRKVCEGCLYDVMWCLIKYKHLKLVGPIKMIGTVGQASVIGHSWVGSIIKGSHCFFEPETLRSLLRTHWFQERIWVEFLMSKNASLNSNLNKSVPV